VVELLMKFIDNRPAKVHDELSTKRDYDESPSYSAEIVERGEVVLPAPGHACMGDEVRVSAALALSTSLSPPGLVLGFSATLDLFLVSRFLGLA
jgi:hypothetical protein